MPVQERLIADVLKSNTFGEAKASFVLFAGCVCF